MHKALKMKIFTTSLRLKHWNTVYCDKGLLGRERGRSQDFCFTIRYTCDELDSHNITNDPLIIMGYSCLPHSLQGYEATDHSKSIKCSDSLKSSGDEARCIYVMLHATLANNALPITDPPHGCSYYGWSGFSLTTFLELFFTMIWHCWHYVIILHIPRLSSISSQSASHYSSHVLLIGMPSFIIVSYDVNLPISLRRK